MMLCVEEQTPRHCQFQRRIARKVEPSEGSARCRYGIGRLGNKIAGKDKERGLEAAVLVCEEGEEIGNIVSIFDPFYKKYRKKENKYFPS